MTSLTKAMPRVPEVLLENISSYLTPKDWMGWRATSKQAFHDVEKWTQKEWTKHSGLLKVPEHSWYLNFLTQTYECIECCKHDTGAPDPEAVQLCRYCFIYAAEGATCERCQLPYFTNNGEMCTECSLFYCEDCIDEGDHFLDPCQNCDHVFCLDCLREHDDINF
jgi:hypothetical protein